MYQSIQFTYDKAGDRATSVSRVYAPIHIGHYLLSAEDKVTGLCCAIVIFHQLPGLRAFTYETLMSMASCLFHQNICFYLKAIPMETYWPNQKC